MVQQRVAAPLVDAGIVKNDWATRLPNGASPASSVIAVITRPGNPKKIRSWEDLAGPGVEIVAINPKTSGNARWGVLAGYGALLREKDAKAQDEATRIGRILCSMKSSSPRHRPTVPGSRCG